MANSQAAGALDS